MSPDEVAAASVGDNEAMREAYRFVEANRQTADGHHGAAPWWYGWMVRTAFMAGVVWQKQRTSGKGVS